MVSIVTPKLSHGYITGKLQLSDITMASYAITTLQLIHDYVTARSHLRPS